MTEWRPILTTFLAFLVDGIFVLPGVITSLGLDTVSAHVGVGHLQLLAQVLGTH